VKKLIKIFASLFIILALMLTLSACGGDKNKGNGENKGTESSQGPFDKLPFDGSGIELPMVPIEPME